ncbi:hypothetical protein T459_35034 [Capsicum annuum]|uniref:Uncharacterized protein n=1 Tax=Capsicum annuum TaxID=4072 RepID=A0A2G2XUJ8_CAPAN|nr:hypothetical protein T459_35034 [Capsicum annuum]
MQSGDLDYTSSDMVISYFMHSREKVNPTIINNDAHVLVYLMDVNADGFSPILRINVVETSFEKPMNSSPFLPWRPIVDDDLNDNENDDDHPINMKDDSTHMESFHWTRKMRKKTVERDSNQDIPSSTEPISIMIKYSPIRKSSKCY